LANKIKKKETPCGTGSTQIVNGKPPCRMIGGTRVPDCKPTKGKKK
jgi:hypothetical protein